MSLVIKCYLCAVMRIRRAELGDVESLLRIFGRARDFMASYGNAGQWGSDYPSRALVEADIVAGNSFVVEMEGGEVIATFCHILGDDPTYEHIEGKWLNDSPYGTIHRIASDGTRQGVFSEVLRWALERCPNMRIDTHKDNAPMLHLLEKEGFTYCGVIYCHNGTPREAFQKEL